MNIFTDSFDHYTTPLGPTGKWDTIGGQFTDITTLAARTGPRGLRLGGGIGGGNAKKFVPTKFDGYVAGAAIKVTTLATEYLIRFRDEVTNQDQCSIQITPAGAIRAGRGGVSPTFVALTPDYQLLSPLNVFHMIELKAVLGGASNGSLAVQVDGQLVTSAINVTNQVNASGISAVQYGGTSLAAMVDDVYINDFSGSRNNDFEGDVGIYCGVVSASGDLHQWTPVGASLNFQCVDENPPDNDTTYVASNTANQEDTYTVPNIPPSLVSIRSVNAWLFARKDDTGLRQFQHILRKAGTNYYGPTTALFQSYNWFMNAYEFDPSTSADWANTAAVNACQFGQKEVT